jgi:REP element-mobilizing transposase RayT
MKQISFFETEQEFYGGSLARAGKRKKGRPMATKRPLHLVLEAKYRILYRHKELLYKQIYAKAAHFGLTAYSVSVNHDHVHFLLRIASRSLYKGFIRALTGIVAR